MQLRRLATLWRPPAAALNHTESAGLRARREFSDFHGFRFYAWTAFVELVAFGVAWVLAVSNGAKAVIAILVPPLFGAFVLGVLWATAPVRQRNEARSELAAVAAVFPDVSIDAGELSVARQPPDDRYGDPDEGFLVRLSFLVTNQSERRISLEARLVLMRAGVPLFPIEPEQSHMFPWNLGPEESAPKTTLKFLVSGTSVTLLQQQLCEDEKPFDSLLDVVELWLWLHERVSDAEVSFKVPTFYRSSGPRAEKRLGE